MRSEPALLLLCGLAVAVSGGRPPTASGQDGAPPEQPGAIEDVRIGGLEQLRDAPKASQELLHMLRRLREKMDREEAKQGPLYFPRYYEHEWALGITNADVLPIAEFARRHRRTRAALLGKFAIGMLRYANTGSQVVDNSRRSRRCFEEITRQYSGTREARIARLLLVLVEWRWVCDMRGRTDHQDRLRRLSASRAALIEALPALEEIDRDDGPLAQGLRIVVAGGEGLSIAARFRTCLGYFLTQMHFESTQTGELSERGGCAYLESAREAFARVAREHGTDKWGRAAQSLFRDVEEDLEYMRARVRRGARPSRGPEPRPEVPATRGPASGYPAEERIDGPGRKWLALIAIVAVLLGVCVAAVGVYLRLRQRTGAGE